MEKKYSVSTHQKKMIMRNLITAVSNSIVGKNCMTNLIAVMREIQVDVSEVVQQRTFILGGTNPSVIILNFMQHYVDEPADLEVLTWRLRKTIELIQPDQNLTDSA